MTVLDAAFFLLCGFMAGDCFTVRAGGLDELVETLRRDLRKVAGVAGTEVGPTYSTIGSMGDVVSDVSDPLAAP